MSTHTRLERTLRLDPRAWRSPCSASKLTTHEWNPPAVLGRSAGIAQSRFALSAPTRPNDMPEKLSAARVLSGVIGTRAAPSRRLRLVAAACIDAICRVFRHASWAVGAEEMHWSVGLVNITTRIGNGGYNLWQTLCRWHHIEASCRISFILICD